jgi:nucleotide-binding universal stress UspA family protein
MTSPSETPERPIHRILIALDASPHSEAALNEAVQLAAHFDAELRGLFVEDVNLLRSADLPMAREVRSFVLPAQAMNRGRIRHQLRRQAERAQQLIQAASRHADVKYSFDVVRGRVTRTLLEAAADADLIALGKTSSVRSSRRKLGSTAQRVLRDASQSVLVLRETTRPNQSIMVYYDGTDAAESALKLAVALARMTPPRPLMVLLPANDADETQRLHDAVTEQCGPTGPNLRIHPLTKIEAARLATVASMEEHGLVVLPAGAPPFEDANLQQFLYDLDRPVLVVR